MAKARRYKIWDKQEPIYTDAGEVLTPEEWIGRYPIINKPGVVPVVAAGEINGGFSGTLGQLKQLAESQGAVFDECCIYIDRMREEYDQKFIHSEEYSMCAEILKKHGFAINTKEQQAAYSFNERIVYFFRELLNQYVNPKTDEEILEEMENAKYSREDDEDWE